MLEKGLAGAVAGHNPRALLPAMLQCEQAVIGQHRGIRMPEDSKKSALVLRECITLRHLLLSGKARGHRTRTSPIFESYSICGHSEQNARRARTGRIASLCRGSLGPNPNWRLRSERQEMTQHFGIGSESLSTARRIEFHQRSCNSA